MTIENHGSLNYGSHKPKCDSCLGRKKLDCKKCDGMPGNEDCKMCHGTGKVNCWNCNSTSSKNPS